MALSPPAEPLPPSPLEEDENDFPFPPAPASPPPSPPGPHASSSSSSTAAKPVLSAPHMALLLVPLLLGLMLFRSMQRLPPTSSLLDALEPFLLLLLLLPLVLFLLTTLSSFSSTLKKAPRLSKAEKKAVKYAHAKQRLRYTRQKYHRKKSQVYKELTEEEQAEVKARMAARKEEREERFAALLVVDAGWLKERENRRKAKREEKKMNKKEEEENEEEVDNEDESDDDSSSALPSSLPSHLRLALDLHYGESIHGLRGTRSLTQQVGWCYHSLKRASSFHNTPIFHLTSFQGPTAEMLKGSGIHNWPIYRHEEELPVVFPRESIVYLSPDAEDVLTAPLDLTKVYVIGGIVDRTVVRGVSQEAASRWHVQTARLPLEYLNLKAKQATAALNVDTMVKVMMAVHANGGDWLAALEECLPKRKAVEKSKGEIKRERREREERGEEEEEEGEEEEEEEEGNVS